MSGISSLVAGTLAEVRALDPAGFSPVLRAAMVDRCRRLARGAFARAKEPGTTGKIEECQAQGRAWMRESKRWKASNA